MKILAEHKEMLSWDLFGGALVGNNTSQLWTLLEVVLSKGEVSPKEEELTVEEVIKFYY